MPPRRKNHFNSELQTEFPFLKKHNNSEFDVQCNVCLSIFSIANNGKSAILDHTKSTKHNRAKIASASSSKLPEFFKKVVAGKSELELAAKEGLIVYHTVKHNQSFRSTDCTSKILKQICDTKFSCARTKTVAIIENVFYPYFMNTLKEELKTVQFISVYYDASNHKDIKLIPILVRYFLPDSGVQVKILELKNHPGETSAIVTDYVMECVNSHGLRSKLVAVCADNANTNFGGCKRRGKKNVFYKLKAELGRDIIGVGCAAHIIHNAIKTASDCLPVDLESIIVKIYGYFHIYTVRVASLKDFCEESSVQYEKMLGYTKTRFLALLPALERVLKMFNPLRSFFLSLESCPEILRAFFENPCSEFWLFFLQHQAHTFNESILEVEGQKTTVTKTANTIKNLKAKLQNRIEDKYLPIIAKTKYADLLEEGSILNPTSVMAKVVGFYRLCLSYLTEWTSHYEEFENMVWIDLTSSLNWSNVKSSIPPIISKLASLGITVNDSEIYDEFCCIKSYVTPEKVTEWNSGMVETDIRWVELLKHLKEHHITVSNLASVVEFVLSLPGSNGSTERIFSEVTKVWTREKSQLKVSTLKTIMFTKCNSELTCSEFYEFLLAHPDILKNIHSSEKYL